MHGKKTPEKRYVFQESFSVHASFFCTHHSSLIISSYAANTSLADYGNEVLQKIMPMWIQIMLRTLIAVVFLILLTKVLGKRQVSELSVFEYITGITIGNLAGYVSLETDKQWYLGMVSLVVWTALSFGIELVQMKSKKVRDRKSVV